MPTRSLLRRSVPEDGKELADRRLDQNEEGDVGELRHAQAPAADRQLEKDLVLDQRHAMFGSEERVELARDARVNREEPGPRALLILA